MVMSEVILQAVEVQGWYPDGHAKSKNGAKSARIATTKSSDTYLCNLVPSRSNSLSQENQGMASNKVFLVTLALNH